MKEIFLFLSLLLSGMALTAQEQAFEAGEWFKFKMSYSGFFKAGEATLTVNNETYKNKPVYHIKGHGFTTGPIRWFFKVEDYYETFMDKKTLLPYRFVRKIDEGGHTKDKIMDFDQKDGKVYVFDRKHNRQETYQAEPSVQDMVSAFYYLRDKIDADNLKEGDEKELDMFFDQESYKFKLKFLGREVLNTDFGKVNTLVFRPYVMAGRVFKEKESLTLWVSDDKNKIPLRIKADLAVGSLKADLDAYKGLKHPFYIIQN